MTAFDRWIEFATERVRVLRKIGGRDGTAEILEQAVSIVKRQRDALRHVTQNDPACTPCRGEYTGYETLPHLREIAKRAQSDVEKIARGET